MKKYLVILIGLLTLTSCDYTLWDLIFNSSLNGNSSSDNLSTSDSVSSTTSSYTLPSVSISQEEGKNYYKASNLRYTLRDVNSQIGWITSNSINEQKLLIVPVDLSDYAGKSTGWTSEKLEMLETAFFGDSNDTTYESVKEYFYKSSYGKLTISGEVTSVYTAPYLYQKVKNGDDTIVDEIATKYYSSANKELLKKYDTDNDGYVDNCLFIYSNAYDGNNFWAWCTYKYPVDNPNYTKPNINNYMWASYDFMNDSYYNNYNKNKIETHTYIHELGHMLGLDDYYCYDENYAWDSAGRLDMQSYNVGDHNAFSKMALGWIDPYVVTGSCEINLKTSAKYPEAILINNNWNGSAFDEYILIEYYTPTGLNKIDAENAFTQGNKLYDYNGLRIYHVDARLVKTSVSSTGNLAASSNYVDEIKDDNNYYVIGASNSYSYSNLKSTYARKYRLLHLLDQGGKNSLSDGYGGNVNTSSALWTGSKKFTPTSSFFANGNKFNDGTEIGYSVSVSNLTDEECTVTITKTN